MFAIPMEYTDVKGRVRLHMIRPESISGKQDSPWGHSCKTYCGLTTHGKQEVFQLKPMVEWPEGMCPNCIRKASRRGEDIPETQEAS